MGQMAVGILYGCEAPRLSDEDEHEESWYVLVEAFNRHAKIDWLSEKPRIRLETEGGKALVGVWVSVGGSGEDGCPFFAEKSLPVDQVASVYQKSVKKAQKLWWRFAKWFAKNRSVELPSATLWITPCEVA